MLNPTVRRSAGSVMLSGAFLLGHGFGPLLPSEERVIANQYKVMFWVITLSYDETFPPWWEKSLPQCQCPHPQGTGDHWMLWWVWKWCESYAAACFAVTRSQPAFFKVIGKPTVKNRFTTRKNTSEAVEILIFPLNIWIIGRMHFFLSWKFM